MDSLIYKHLLLYIAIYIDHKLITKNLRFLFYRVQMFAK